jgi:hypothetical protein
MGEKWITHTTENVIKKSFTSQMAVPVVVEWKAKLTKRSQPENEGYKIKNLRRDSKATNENEWQLLHSTI